MNQTFKLIIFLTITKGENIIKEIVVSAIFLITHINIINNYNVLTQGKEYSVKVQK